MQIIEDITYSIDDIIDQIKETFGFIYNEVSDHEGYILLGSKIKLNIVFNEEVRKLDEAVIEFPKDKVDISESTSTVDIYSSSIESSVQIVDLIKRMLGQEDKEV